MSVPTIGQFIGGGRYRVDRFLGAGGYGQVWEVFDQHQQQSAALKLLAGPRPDWWEARRLTALQSEYILPILNADTDAGVAYIVTQLARHGSASSRMSPTGVPPAAAVRWTQHACRGAARAHQAGFVHRDIKPDNLFLTDVEDAVLGDFGIAHPLDAHGLAPALGTPVTVAPEATPGARGTSVLSDVYSLGATLYALLAGTYAHMGPDPASTYAMVVNDPIPELRESAPHVSQALRDRVVKAMAKDPSDRYQSASEFDAALGSLPLQERNWWRTDEHSAQGHLGCWRGHAQRKADATVCVVPAGSRYEILACNDPSGRRITAACRAPARIAAIPQNLRAAMRAAR